jgi:hypothetical protein
MSRRAVIGSLMCCAFAAYACSSGNGSGGTAPTDVFAGNWVGPIDSGSIVIDTVNVTMTQTGGVFSGSGTVELNGNSAPVTISGTSAPPTLTGQLVIVFNGADTSIVTLNGSFITPDSIAASVSQNGGLLAGMFLKKQ